MVNFYSEFISCSQNATLLDVIGEIMERVVLTYSGRVSFWFKWAFSTKSFKIVSGIFAYKGI